MPIKIWIAWKIVSKRYLKASSSGPKVSTRPFQIEVIVSTIPCTMPPMVVLMAVQMVDAVVEMAVQIPDKNSAIPETMPLMVSEIACQAAVASSLMLSHSSDMKVPISVQCSLITITRFATANTIAAMTPATKAGAPRITAPIAARAIPMPIKTSFTKEKPLLNISTKFFTAMTTPAITAPIPESALSTAEIPVVAVAIPLMAADTVLIPAAIFGAMVIMVPMELIILPTKISKGPRAATKRATTRITCFTGSGS